MQWSSCDLRLVRRIGRIAAAERARLKERQGVNYPVLEGLTVADPKSLVPVAADGATLGEVLRRGNGR
jgi:hypothetical protein